MKTKTADAAATGIEKADIAVAETMAPAQEHGIVRALGFASEIADQPQMVAINSLTLAAGLIGGKPRLARAGVRMLSAHLLATAIKHVIKRRIDRTRPYAAIEEGEHRMEPGRRKQTEFNSFPSGHTAGAVAAARGYAREFPEHAAATTAASAAIAAIQIPRCAHYPTDLAAGWAIGAAAEAVVDRTAGPLLDWVERLAVERRAELDAR